MTIFRVEDMSCDHCTRAITEAVRRVDPGDPALAPLYDTFASRSNGLLDRNAWLWRRTLSPQAPLELSVHLLGLGVPVQPVVGRPDQAAPGLAVVTHVADLDRVAVTAEAGRLDVQEGGNVHVGSDG